MSVFRFATHLAYKNNLTIINKYLVKYSSPNSIGSSKAIFLLTESHFFLFEQNKNKLIFMCPWKNLKAISVNNDNFKLSLTFINIDKTGATEVNENKQFVMWSMRSDLKSVEIKSKVIVLLQRVLSKSELSILKIKDLNEPVYYPTARSPIARFRMWDILKDPSYNLDMPTFADIHKKLVYSLVFRDDNLQINNFPQSEKILPIYLDMLKVAPQVRQLRVPMIPAKRIYDYIIELLANNDYLQYLEISGKCNKEFFYLIKAIKDNKNSDISSLSFVNTQFTINELTLLYDFIISGSNINALEFHSSIAPEAVDYFYSSFLTPVLCEKLAILNLDQSPGVNTEKLFPKITNISMLSLEGCDIELGDIFNCIAQGTAIGLRELNISRCYVKSIPDENLPQFNRNFQKLIINEVSWPSGSLVPFFRFIFTHFRRSMISQDPQDQFGPSLYFSNETADTDEWLNLFDYLGTVDNYRDLVTLGWNGNPVHQNLFNFLKRNSQLTTLMMSCCFSEECPESINDFCQFISTSTSFTTLIIAGNEINHFGKFTNNVIRSLSNHQSLKELDISFNYGGDETTGLLLTFIQNSQQLEMIDFDAVCCQRTDSIVNLMKNLRMRKDQIHISFPTVEFTRLKNEKLISKEVFDEITHMFKVSIDPKVDNPASYQDGLQINVKDNANSNEAATKKKGKNEDEEDDDLPYVPPSQILTKNYCIYKHYNPPDFPCVVSKQIFEEIKRQARHQKSIVNSPRRQNSPTSRSVFSSSNSPRQSNFNNSFTNNRAFNNNVDDDEKVWPTSQAEIAEAKNNLRSAKERDTPESTKSPKSLDHFNDEQQSPKQRNSSNLTNSNMPGRQNSRVVKRKSRKVSKPKQEIFIEEEDEDYESEDYKASSSSNNRNNNVKRNTRNSQKRVKPKTTKKRRLRNSNAKINKNKRSNNDLMDYDNNYDYDSDGNNNHDNYIKTPKNVKPLFEHSKQFEEEDIEGSPAVSLTESTDDDEEFVFEEKQVPVKPKKNVNARRKGVKRQQSPKRKAAKGKKAKNQAKKNQPNARKEESNDYNYDDDNNNAIANEYDENLSDGNYNDEGSDNSNELINDKGKKYNSRNVTKNYADQKPKGNEKLYKSQPGKIKKSLIQREKNNHDDDDDGDDKQLKNREIPQNYQIDEDVDSDSEDDEDIFNSQIFNDEMPKIDKYENSANWQQYDKEFALNALFSKIKSSKTV